jgi:hypothetical protein
MKSILENLSDLSLILLEVILVVGMPRCIDLGVGVINLWANWLEVVRFTCEAQGVISARLMLFASGGPSAATEADLMISEKLFAFADAQAAAERALADGLGIYVAAAQAYAPLRRQVHANSRRLVRSPH